MFVFLLFTVFVGSASMQKLNCSEVDDCPDLLTECLYNQCTCVTNAELDPEISDKCACKDGYSNKGNKCVKDMEGPPRPVPCELQRHCVSNFGVHSNCVKRNCYCIEGAKYNDTGNFPTCFKTQYELDGACESDAECQIADTKMTKCLKNTCQCIENFVASPHGTCLKDVNVMGGECDFDVQCNTTVLGQGAACLMNKCDCSKEYKRVDNQCFYKADIGGDCDSEMNCNHINNAHCSEETCTCMKGYTNSNATFCLEVAKSFKSACEQNSQCSEGLGDKVVCKNNICDCADIYKYNPKSNECEKESENGVSEKDLPNPLDSKVSVSSRANPGETRSNGCSSLFKKNYGPPFYIVITAFKILTMV